MPTLSHWQVRPTLAVPEVFVQAVQQWAEDVPGQRLAQLLWQRGICEPGQVPGFLNPNQYVPTSPFAFGDEMEWAIARLVRAYRNHEAIAIWGDFDADGITATAVLWDGLGQFFPQGQQLTYVIPNRLTDSHGLHAPGIEQLAAQGYRLIVTCDTGSTNPAEIELAQRLGLDVIVTDHHTRPPERPAVVAMVNPRDLPPQHPLATLSGVAVAYKLVEALYERLPEVATRPLVELLDLVAIGLVADLVELRGDCRYLAQRGIEQLQCNLTQTPPPRPGVARLLELCQRSGDRPTDISFGIGPRINAISRIHGDARFGVELLTSQDVERCRALAEQTELANARRKALQRDVAEQVTARLATLDLSTTHVIVLADPDWSVGVLGLVAGQIAQEYGRPTILLSIEQANRETTPLTQPTASATPREATQDRLAEGAIARGSARSVNDIDLYQLVQHQAHLLTSFGGHPYAAGLSLPVENLPLFVELMNRQLREQCLSREGAASTGPLADLTVTVADLGKSLFRELRLLEPCGMGNPTPKLLIQNCWFEKVWHRNIQDVKKQRVRYIKTEFEIVDESGSRFPGVWWGHYKDEIPNGRCDAIAELDFNSFQKRYEIRLLAVSPATEAIASAPVISRDWIVDWRTAAADETPPDTILVLRHCPSSWDELALWFRRAAHEHKTLAIAYAPPSTTPPVEIWTQLAGIAKYLSRTGKPISRTRLKERLGIGDRALHYGFKFLSVQGFQITSGEDGFQLRWLAQTPGAIADADLAHSRDQFFAAIREEQFRRQYFYSVPLATIQAVAAQVLRHDHSLKP